MAAKHENYTAALAALAPSPRTVDMRSLVGQLADPVSAEKASDQLRCMAPERLIPGLVAGLGSGVWRVRRSCCRLLDDLDFTPESLEALQHALDDPDPRVRRSAMHTLSCQHCKPNGCALDIQPIFERMAHDTSRIVRSSVVKALGWQRHGPWAEQLVTDAAANDPSTELREDAQATLVAWAFERASDAEGRLLPERLRTKTERHPFEWVALDGSRLVAGSWSREISRDFRNWRRGADVTRASGKNLRWFFVRPDSEDAAAAVFQGAAYDPALRIGPG
ncbi:MAG TPA: HEAT repeat domain-containing protein [Candidatus Dormibacteraeota bacterium]|nr:HEAT repeat domain-containing protein [Candidatus Dormibacteraeota bacterium]